MYHYYVKQNPTELYYERHQLLVGHANSCQPRPQSARKEGSTEEHEQ